MAWDGFDPLTDDMPSRIIDEDEEAEAEARWKSSDFVGRFCSEFVANRRALAQQAESSGENGVHTLIIGSSPQSCRLLHAAFGLPSRVPLGCVLVPGAPITGITARPNSSETTFAIYSGGGGVAIGCCQLRMPPEHAVGAARALVDGLAPKRVIVLSQQALQLSTREDIGGVFSLRTDVWPSDCALPEPMAPGVPLAGLEAALLSCCQARAIQAAALCQPLSRPVVDGSDLLELAAATSSVLAACGLERDGQAVSEAAKSIATAEDAAAAHHSTNTVYM